MCSCWFQKFVPILIARIILLEVFLPNLRIAPLATLGKIVYSLMFPPLKYNALFFTAILIFAFFKPTWISSLITGLTPLFVESQISSLLSYWLCTAVWSKSRVLQYTVTSCQSTKISGLSTATSPLHRDGAGTKSKSKRAHIHNGYNIIRSHTKILLITAGTNSVVFKTILYDE